MTPFVDQSEAFLLGITLGNAQGELGELSFADYLDSRLGAFVPSMRVTGFVELDRLPDDAELISDHWYRSSAFYCIMPKDDGWVGSYMDDSRQSLIDLVNSSIAKELVLRGCEPTPSDAIQDDVQANREALPHVKRVLTRIAIDSDCELEFNDGVVFGEFIILLEKMQHHAESIWFTSLSSSDFVK